jgi:hypothetical protein
MSHGYGSNLIDRDTVRKQPCPKCGAAAGEPCKHDPDKNHMERVRAARAARPKAHQPS